MVVPPKTPNTRASARSRVPATTPGPTRSRKVGDAARPPTSSAARQEGALGMNALRSNHISASKNASPTLFVSTSSDGQPKEEDREPLKAYLRIRPAPEQPTHPPYLTVQSDTTVLTIPPAQSLRLARPATSYTFSNVFPPTTAQVDFYARVAHPLVQNLMSGEHGLLFAYGVSGAGKTWTIQGGKGAGEEGLVWRVLRSVMSSVRGQQGDVPVRMTGRSVVRDESARDSLGSGLDSEEIIDASVTVDRNYTYSVFVSYAEVYNEKVFDLLEPNAASASGKRKALALKSDPSGGGKYIHGLREVRVRTTAEAHGVFSTGLMARQVSGTKVNHHSSRSHAIFSIRIVRVHKGRPTDPSSIYNSRLSIVDLAGSERFKATLASGDRLKESGSINKSLMVLGQCMEVLRSNQRKLALAGSVGGESVKLGVVPFRHSKLTELFQDFFVGEGRAVMVVNVNPYDGGFDEIVNVMRFSALATQVKTGHSHSSGLARLARGSDIPKMIPEDNYETSAREELFSEDEDDEAEPEDPLVTHLFEQLEDMRQKLYEAEIRCAVVESETREEVTREMEGRMRAMERMFSERVIFDAEQNEAKIDSKIDLVNRAMMSALGRTPQAISDSDGEVEEQLRDNNDDSNIFFDSEEQLVSDMANVGHPNVGQEQSDMTGSEENESSDDVSEEEETEASEHSEEWAPSGEENSASSVSSAAHKKPTRRSSAKPGVNVSMTGKENTQPRSTNAPRTSTKTSTRKSGMVKREASHDNVFSPSALPMARKHHGSRTGKHQTDSSAKAKLEKFEEGFVIHTKAPPSDATGSLPEEGVLFVPEAGDVDPSKKKKRCGI